ncbi:aminomethyltransferase [Antricoccus suffuscus]|uniref:aminomethyltransferase n=1 Tax=Antricoccus suffuscus TaxID=1629062 RepID=A0A2T0ZYA7_9ACTN|nr:glycine cleavage system aminomethyltransferase GcvT [Antricoccus suffuscus]PRZ41342.1 aminomethyltransferase [Antricoccus suffuscus]
MSDAETHSLKTSPLHDRHVALGAKMADFGGWEMPIEYPGTGGGVLIEHKAVREGVGVFDVSHLGKASVRGPGAAQFINSTLSNDLERICAGQAQYTLCCDDATGGVVDDLIVYYRSAEDIFLVPNAANTAEVVRRLNAVVPEGITITDEHEDYAVLAVQGPNSTALIERLGLPADHDYMSFTASRLGESEVTVCRTGYTGEHGYELVVPWSAALSTWDALLEHGESFGARPCGLGARDTLRTEMGYPLHGQDLSMEITPNQARSGWAVGWKKPQFWGRDPLSAEREAKPARLLWGLRSNDRGIPRPHMEVKTDSGEVCGEVTSGTFSPTLRIGIGLALIERERGVTEGSVVEVDVRGRKSSMTVVKPPFVDSHVR